MLTLCAVCIRLCLLLYFGGDDVELLLLLFIINCYTDMLHCVVVPLWLKFVISKLELVLSENFSRILFLLCFSCSVAAMASTFLGKMFILHND